MFILKKSYNYGFKLNKRYEKIINWTPIRWNLSLSLSCSKEHQQTLSPKQLSLEISKNKDFINLTKEQNNGLITNFNPKSLNLTKKNINDLLSSISKAKDFEELEDLLVKNHFPNSHNIVEHYKKLNFYLDKISNHYPSLKTLSQTEINNIMNDAVKLTQKLIPFETKLAVAKAIGFDQTILGKKTSNTTSNGKTMVVDESGTTPCMDTFLDKLSSLAANYNHQITTTCLWIGLGAVPFGGGTIAYLACVGSAESDYNFYASNEWDTYRGCVGYTSIIN